MCTNLTKIKPKYYRHEIYVKCGKCKACLQEKANRLASRICAQYSDKEDIFFVTLTYHNDFIPYIEKDNLLRFLSKDDDKLFVYRDKYLKHVYNRHIKKYKYKVTQERECLAFFFMSDFEDFGIDKFQIERFLTYNYKGLQSRYNSEVYKNRISVLWYPDLQKFLKRLRMIVKREFFSSNSFPNNNDCPIKFFAAPEYGSTTCRAHFHLLLSCPKGYYSFFQYAVTKAWPFDDFHRRKAGFEKARSASRYVASYVNCFSSVPELFSAFKPFRPTSHFSTYYGFNQKNFSYDEILACVREGSFRYDKQIIRNGVPSSVAVLVPQYVVNRYFPKFKGFSNLDVTSLACIAEKPERLYKYASKTEQNIAQQSAISKHILKIKSSLTPSQQIDYETNYPFVWQIYKVSALKLMHEKSISPLYDYDNISDYYNKNVVSNFVSKAYRDVKRRGLFSLLIDDPNKFPNNVDTTRHYSDIFDKCDKSKKIKNTFIGSFTHM